MPAKMPSQYVMTTIASMGNGDSGYIPSSAVNVDPKGGVWLAAAITVASCQAGIHEPVRVAKSHAGYRIWVALVQSPWIRMTLPPGEMKPVEAVCTSAWESTE